MITGVEKVGIIGAGRMGLGIANLVSKYYQVTVYDLDIKKALENVIPAVSLTTDISRLSDSDLIIESVYEDLNVKLEVICQIERLVSKHTVICTNTSSISVNTLAEQLKYKSRFLGMHFMNPADKNKLIEIVISAYTSNDILELVQEIAKNINREFILLKDAPGFVVNRLLIPMINEAIEIYDNGIASASDIDKAMVIGCGHPVGPLALADMIGLDIIVEIMLNLEKSLSSKKYAPSKRLITMVAENKLGKKTKQGFYTY